MELDEDGVFAPSVASAQLVAKAPPSWKSRYLHFRTKLTTFRVDTLDVPGFQTKSNEQQEITQVEHPDMVAYCRCKVRGDALTGGSGCGVYIELRVLSNPDNLSVAVVDFDAGGQSSMTFSPDTGAVIRERKVCEEPRRVEGSYLQRLNQLPSGKRFRGSVGIYIFSGHIAFFRRCESDGVGSPPSSWESTGFVSDLSWVDGQCLTPCVAFRDEGEYHVRLDDVGSTPPVKTSVPSTYADDAWSLLEWDAGTDAA
jgi:hypothetical protein